MTEGTATRKLIRQEWKPLAGRRIEVFVAMPAGYSVPGDEWTDELRGKSEVVNEVIGYAEVQAHSKFPAYEDFDEFVAALEEDAEKIISWEGDWAGRATEAMLDNLEEEAEDQPGREEAPREEAEETPDENETDDTPDDEEDSERPAGDGSGKQLVVTTDDEGFRVEKEYDPDDEPYELPPEADDDDLQHGVVYQGLVNNTKHYGVFVEIPRTNETYGNVSGLLHEKNMGLRNADEFDKGDELEVMLEDFEDGVSFVHPDTVKETGVEVLFDNA
jgi:hypothetical protein